MKIMYNLLNDDVDIMSLDIPDDLSIDWDTEDFQMVIEHLRTIKIIEKNRGKKCREANENKMESPHSNNIIRRGGDFDADLLVKNQDFLL